MAEAKTSLVINGVDRTAGAFASIAARASAAGSQLKGMLGGALAAAGAYMGFSAIKGGINELGHLSDIATKANMSVDDLTKTSLAMDVMGIQRMGVDEFAKALDYMQKTTGKVGMEGFYSTIESLAKIEDRAKRGQEAMRIFGRTGMELMPVINGAAENGVSALRNVVDAMPGITQAAATSGDNVADAMGIATAGVKSIWLQAIGAICGWFDSQFVGGVQGAALMAAAWLEYYAKVGATKAMYYYSMMRNSMSELGTGVGTFIGAISEGASVKDAFAMASKEYDKEREYNLQAEADEKASIEARQAAWRAAYEERKAKAAEFVDNVNKAAISAKEANLGAGGPEAPGAASGAVKKAPNLRNSLMMAGSNEARKLGLLGPTMQTESKKQTDLLRKIVKNTEKSTDATQVEVID